MARIVEFETTKAPGAILAYGFDWSSRGWLAQLGEGVTVEDGSGSTTAPVWTVAAETVVESPSVLAIDSDAVVAGAATWVRLTSGTADVDYIVSVVITCSDGSKDQRSFRIHCRER